MRVVDGGEAFGEQSCRSLVQEEYFGVWSNVGAGDGHYVVAVEVERSRWRPVGFVVDYGGGHGGGCRHRAVEIEKVSLRIANIVVHYLSFSFSLLLFFCFFEQNREQEEDEEQ